MTTRADFTAALLTAARATLGIRETAHNSGPQIDGWLRYVHARPGDSWCAAWVCSMHLHAAESLGLPNPCPRTAGALRLWDLTLPECRQKLPAPGDVFVLDTGEPGGAGHVGIVELVTPDGQTIITIEGNSTHPGYHSAEYVAKHTWRPADGKRGKLIGYLNMIKAVIPDEPPKIGIDSLPRSPFA